MKKIVFVSLFLAFGIQVAFAHHNFAAHYRTEEMVEISGVVTEFRFVNPHARVYVETTNAEGNTEVWMVEGDASVALRRSGWTENQLKPGDLVEITGNPSRSGANMLGWKTLNLADGTSIGGGSGRLEERLRILDATLATFREQRDQ
ncbi:MAG: hypothetical protein CMM56_04905 [Rhodospirillaceae bacterium]|nr:hypothetical protein [Rhodospirillaceae bacterium]|tara:strand:- start:2062 stop:2502 length:441 start_codon:yes stop_codon:yes gene_type:complete